MVVAPSDRAQRATVLPGVPHQAKHDGSLRICSLVPGATEIVAGLGLIDSLVGISHECDFPPEAAAIPRVMWTSLSPDLSSKAIDDAVRMARAQEQPLFSIDRDALRLAAPELVITQDLCDICAMTPKGLTAALQQLPVSPTLLSLAPSTLADIWQDIDRVGQAVGRAQKALTWISTIQRRLVTVRETLQRAPTRPRVACLEWLDPLYVAGHWAPEMVEAAGGIDVLGQAGAPSRRIIWDDIVRAAPDVVIVMPCGFSVARTVTEWTVISSQTGWQQLAAQCSNRVFAVDANSYFSRPGPRLIEGIELLAQLLHPELTWDLPPSPSIAATRLTPAPIAR